METRTNRGEGDAPQVPVNPILIVDDEVLMLKAMRLILLTAGLANVRTCPDSRAAYTMLLNEIFSLVLLDLSMPCISGYQILQRSASLDFPPPIIVVSGSSDVATIAKCRSAGAVDFLAKPVDRDRLLVAVNAALSRHDPQEARS